MRYYITGANGFIGTAICKYLEGEQIFKAGKEINPFELRHADIIIHLGAYGNHADQTNIFEILQANITRLQDLLQFTRNCDFKKFYNISTSSVTLPVQTAYSASKLIGEQLVTNYGDKRIVNIRPYSVYGPGEAAHRFIPTVIRCLNSGEQMQLDLKSVHDWIFVDDFVRCMFEGYTEIGSGTQATNMDIVTALELISGKTLNYTPVTGLRNYDTSRWVCTDRVPCRPLFEGLKQTYESFTQ